MSASPVLPRVPSGPGLDGSGESHTFVPDVQLRLECVRLIVSLLVNHVTPEGKFKGITYLTPSAEG